MRRCHLITLTDKKVRFEYYFHIRSRLKIAMYCVSSVASFGRLSDEPREVYT